MARSALSCSTGVPPVPRSLVILRLCSDLRKGTRRPLSHNIVRLCPCRQRIADAPRTRSSQVKFFPPLHFLPCFFRSTGPPGSLFCDNSRNPDFDPRALLFSGGKPPWGLLQRPSRTRPSDAPGPRASSVSSATDPSFAKPCISFCASRPLSNPESYLARTERLWHNIEFCDPSEERRHIEKPARHVPRATVSRFSKDFSPWH